jgi:hypothetical protein
LCTNSDLLNNRCWYAATNDPYEVRMRLDRNNPSVQPIVHLSVFAATCAYVKDKLTGPNELRHEISHFQALGMNRRTEQSIVSVAR